jgi:hypothetical protein
MISLKLNEAQAEWGVATLTRVVEGVATGGVALPELMGMAFVDYMTDVRGVTPPAKGARIVGSLELSRGKAAIDVDLGRAFIVAAKGVVSAIPNSKSVGKLAGVVNKVSTKTGRRVAARIAKVVNLKRAKQAGRYVAAQAKIGAFAAGKKAASEIKSAADEDPQSWYEQQRRNGRFAGRQRMEIDAGTLSNIRRALHARVGYLQSGWNAASERFGAATPSWISGKGGRGTINVGRTDQKIDIRAENQVQYAGGIAGMQRRLNYAARKAAKRAEAKAAATAEKAMQEIIDK